ncbi:MAG: hypothetical protein V1762_04580 [Nitrospirota bacterium]
MKCLAQGFSRQWCIHWPIADPVRTIGSEEKIINEFRKTSDAIKEGIIKFIAGARDAQRIA